MYCTHLFINLLKQQRVVLRLLLTLLLPCANVCAQSEFPPKAKWDTAYISKVLEECNTLRLYNLPQAKQKALQCLRFSKENNYLNGSYESNNVLALIYFDLGNSDSCFYYNFKALAIAQNTSPANVVNSYVNIANEYVKIFETDSASFYCNKALHIKKGLTKSNQVKIKTCFFTIYILQEKFAMVNVLGNELLKDYPTVNTPSLHARFLHSLTVYYLRTHDNRYEPTRNKGIAQALLAKDSCILYSFYQTQGLDLFFQSKFNVARKQIKNTLSFYKRLQSNSFLSKSYFYLYMLERHCKNFNLAKCYLDSSYAVNPKKELGRTTKDDFIYTNSFADLYTDAGDYKQASEYLRKAISIQDSLQVKLYNKTVLEFQTKYETEIKDNKIKLQQLELSKERLTRNWLVALFSIIVIAAFWLYNRIRAKQKARDEIAKLKAKNNLLETQQKLLLTQMNPHFIFNSLKSIQNFVLTNNTQQASNYIANFGELMRAILEASRKEYITLEDELKMLTLYIQLEQAKAQHKFEFTLDVADDVLNDLYDTHLPSMLLQPIAENAIHHGLSNITAGAQLTISVLQINEQYLKIDVTDNGGGIGASTNNSGLGTASKIIQERIAMYNQNNKLPINYEIVDLRSATVPQGTKVSLTIPIT
ncbi:MAG: histidine kinase [Bacteroidia bacterium]